MSIFVAVAWISPMLSLNPHNLSSVISRSIVKTRPTPTTRASIYIAKQALKASNIPKCLVLIYTTNVNY